MATKTFDQLDPIATGKPGDVVAVNRAGKSMRVPLDSLGVSKYVAEQFAATGLPSFDPTLLPFASNSVWRLGISQSAQFAADSDPRNVSLNGSNPYVNYYQFSHPVNVASTSDPLATVTDSYHPVGGTPPGGTWQEYIPATAIIAAGTDRHMHVITPDKKDVIEHFGTVRVDTTHYTTTRRHRVNLYGGGIGPQNGTRAYGGSALGGLIRLWEMDPANPNYTGRIDHPIAMALLLSQLKYTGEAGLPAFGGIYDENGYGQHLGYVWPASEQDGGSPTQYTGPIPMGSYFAIPPTVDLTTLGIASVPGMMVAKAMQDYGAYVTDATGTTAIYLEDAGAAAEGAFASALLANSAAEMKAMFAALKVVTTNSPTTPNGGLLGAARRGVKPSIPGSSSDSTKAPLASPAFTGTPTAPTPSAGTNTTQVATAAFVKAAIDALVGGAPTALDTLLEIANQLGNDETAAAAITALVDARAIIGVNAVTAAATLVGSRRNTIDATSGAYTVTLPVPSKVGQLLLLDRTDATTNTVTVTGATGATFRGNAAGTFTLVGVGVAGEGSLLVAESLTSWTIAGSIKPKAWLDALYAQVLEPVTTANSGTAVTLGGLGVQDVTLTGNATLIFPSLPSAGVAKTFVLVLRQDTTGSRTVTWPVSVKWPGGVAPVLSAVGGKVDVFTFTSIDAASWFGFTGALDMR